MTDSSDTIFRFLVDTLKVSGSPYNVIDDQLILAQCEVEIPRTFFRAAHTELTNLQLVCKPELLAKYPGSELVTKGSYRLQWFSDGIRKRGRITRATFPYELDPRKIQREITGVLGEPPQFYFEQPSLIYHPYLLANFKVSLETDEKYEELYHLSINLVNGEIGSGLLWELTSRKPLREPPRRPIKRNISYRDAFEALFNHLKWLLQNHDRKWLESAKTRWEEELRYLEAYYRENRTETPDADHSGFYQRAAEIYRKFQPAIRIQICNISLCYLPLVNYTVEPFDLPGTRQLLIYDPLRRKLRQQKTSPAQEVN